MLFEGNKMKYHKYWAQCLKEVVIDGKAENVRVLAGSDISKEDALNKVDDYTRLIQNRIDQKAGVEDYEVEIKEHVVEVLDDKNIVTVNRYGALVWNTTQYTILDLDQFVAKKSFFDFFRKKEKVDKKQLILNNFKSQINLLKPFCKDFRVYETCKGLRIIGKNYFDPAHKDFNSIMSAFQVDWLYAILSKKQNCYRARLTPKPYRIPTNTIKIKSPLDCETEEYKNWSLQYAEKSERLSSVKFLEMIGEDFSRDFVIQYHDKMTKASAGNKLA